MFEKRLFVIMLALGLLLSGQQVRAQQQITPEKAALIQGLLQMSGVKSKIEKDINDKFNDLIKPYLNSLTQKSSGVAGGQKIELEEVITRLDGKFKELLQQSINLDKVIEEVYYPIYDKYYTEDELKDIVNFFNTTAGKKIKEISVQIYDETEQGLNEALFPKITQLVSEVVEQDKKQPELKNTSQPENQ